MDWIRDRYRNRENWYDLPKGDLVNIVKDVAQAIENSAPGSDEAVLRELINTAKDPVGQFQEGIQSLAQVDAVQDFVQTKQNLSNIGNRLQMADILRLAQIDPQEARQAYIDFQLRSGQIPSAPPTRGSVEQGGSEVESPEDWWKRNKGKR